MVKFVALLILAISTPAWAEITGVFNVSKAKCEAELIPDSLADKTLTMTFAADGTLDVQASFFGWMGGDCKASVPGTYHESGGLLQITLGHGRFTGSFTSPCHTLIDALPGTFTVARGRDGTVKLVSRQCSLELK